MPRQVKTLVPGLSLPDGNTYFQVNMVVELTDEEFARIDAAVFSSGKLEDLGAISSSTPVPITLTYAPSVVTPAGAGRTFRLTLTGNATLAAPTGMADGQRIVWQITQDATGGRVLTLGSSFNVGGMSLNWSTTGGKTDYLGAVYRQSTGKFDVIAFAAGY